MSDLALSSWLTIIAAALERLSEKGAKLTQAARVNLESALGAVLLC